MDRDLNGPWTARTALATTLLIVLLALVPIAHASPPDPLWIPGIYDASDLDDALVVVTSLENQIHEGPSVVPPSSLVARVLLVEHPVAPAVIPRTTPARAPPTS